MRYTSADLMVPVAGHGIGTAFVVWISEGSFENDEKYGQLAISIRCAFFSLSYAILAIHFVYRYLALFNPNLAATMLKPVGVLCILIYFSFNGVFWVSICETFLYSTDEVRQYIEKDFYRIYNEKPNRISMVNAMYFDGSPDVVKRSWVGITTLTSVSIFSIATYFIFGYKIIKRLQSLQTSSRFNVALHKHLLKALSVQTFIPVFISFAPCLVVWYAPAIGFDTGKWNNYFAATMISTFPTLDPLAIILLLPAYRNRLVKFFKKPKPNSMVFTSRTTTVL